MSTTHISTSELEIEKQEWIDALISLKNHVGQEAAEGILRAVEEAAKQMGLNESVPIFSPYRNTVSVDEQPKYPGDLAIEQKIIAILRWNALVMVMRANKVSDDLGGHIASYASAAEIFEVGFNHFFKGGDSGDLVYFQPHSAPGIYARAFLEGRLPEEQLARYRQEVDGDGLCSYPHPWLMPDFWQFPTGSMGLGPINAIYQARFMRYMEARGIGDTQDKHVWGIFGDGEMDEPESVGALTLASREKLNNLSFIINCNLQRLDGPVRGNGQVIPELESLFKGAGWNVVKVLWGSEWDELFARDTNNILLKRFAATVDGKYQTLGANDGDYNLKHFFAQDPEIMALVSHMSDSQINDLKRGGHDLQKLYAAFNLAKASNEKPTVILAKTKKGYGIGGAGESKMTAHQTKKLDIESLLEFRDRFSIPLSNEQVENLEFYQPNADSAERQYLLSRRDHLGGYLPKRVASSPAIAVPNIKAFGKFALEGSEKNSSTTMALVRMLSGLLKDKVLGSRIVPIVADEARTFGMASLFRQIGIYSPEGQLYQPEDSSSLLAYIEKQDGQLLEEGISEAGAMASWTAAATSYSTHQQPLLPIYIYYSMFGFQRVGDMIWAAGDQRARGFLIGATAGKTTLSGEGLQHQDGSSQIAASLVPNCRSYDPCYAYELAYIVEYGAKRMLEQNKDEFYYITVTNEKYPQASAPLETQASLKDDIIKGMYHFAQVGNSTAEKSNGHVQLLGSGAIFREVEAAAKILSNEFSISSDIWSVTSFNELGRDANEVASLKRQPTAGLPCSHLAKCLQDRPEPVIAVSDYAKQHVQQIACHLSTPFYALGTDGYGRSDTRINLRRFFEVDRNTIAITAIQALYEQGRVDKLLFENALERLNISAKAYQRK